LPQACTLIFISTHSMSFISIFAGILFIRKHLTGHFLSEFPTSRMEMEAVADIFDGDGDGFIDYKEFITALRPDRQDVSVYYLHLSPVSQF
jgi:hypothetical protein